jgi:SAM-dependent methyltransferase
MKMSIRYMHTLRRRLSTQSMTNQDLFNAMEHRNWEQAFVTYDEGFGPLTRQPIPTILTHVNFPPADIDDGGQRTVRLLDVATGPGFVLSSAIDSTLLSSSDDRHYHLTGLDVSKNFISLAEQRISSQLAAHSQMNTKNIIVDFVEGNAEELPFPDNAFDSISCNFGILHFFKKKSF